MNSANNPRPGPPALERRRVWPFVATIAGLLLLLGLAVPLLCWFLFRGTPTPNATTATVVTAPRVAESVALTDFADQATRGWGTVPRGTQVCDGVTFVCDGAIRPSGLRAARDGKNYPGAILDVPVRGRGARIHLLQSSENSSGAIAGAPYGRMILHYANGEIRRFDLLFAVHGRDWMHTPQKEEQPLLDANTKIGWSELHPRNGMMIRFFHTTFTNPLPAVEITTADFVSPLYSANLLLFGLTVDDDPHPLAPAAAGQPLADIPRTDKIVVTLQDAAGRPASDGVLAWTAVGPRGQVDFPPMRADAQGCVPLEFQRGALRQIRYTATAADGKTLSGELPADDTGNFAPSAVIQFVR